MFLFPTVNFVSPAAPFDDTENLIVEVKVICDGRVSGE
jgi:hypothetical protein